jgi:hypothetical protein
MSLKAELETWAAALKAYDEEDFEKSLELFSVRFVVFYYSEHALNRSFCSKLPIHPRYFVIWA